MIFAPAPRRAAAPVALTLGCSLLSACFDVTDAPPLVTDGSTGTTTELPTTTGPEPTTTLDPSATGVDPDTSTTSVDPDTGTTSVEPDTGSEGPQGGCGDGVLDPATETCDDGNLEPGDLCDPRCQVETLVLAFTGGPQVVEVPAWVDALEVEAWGAEGGDSVCCEGPDDDGGLGGYVAGVLTTIGGTTLVVHVGGTGQPQGAGGYNGGGTGGEWGAGGGGASDIRIGAGMLANRLVVAAGGGGGNCGCPDHGAGGGGGGLSGQAGIANLGGPAGGGGTQAAGGPAGQDGTAGTLGQGGSTASGDLYHFAGGGGGYYGGGGAYAAGGGGGSSFLGVLRNGVTMPAVRQGHGEVRLTPIALP
jgi:cysteine-rich repeat protein